MNFIIIIIIIMAFYFAYLGLYTRWLAYPAVTGAALYGWNRSRPLLDHVSYLVTSPTSSRPLLRHVPYLVMSPVTSH